MVCAGAAQASFIGFGVGVGGSLVHSKMDYESDRYIPRSFSSTENSGSVSLDLSYGLELTSDFIATIGVNYAFNKVDSGTIRIREVNGIVDLDSKLKNRYSLYIAPGYRLSDDNLIYAKLAYHSAKSEFSGSYVNGKESKTHRGFGFGAGYALAYSDNFDVSFEIQHILYNKKSETIYTNYYMEAKPTSTEFSLLFKYRF